MVGARWRRSGSRSSARLEYVELYGAYAECEAIYGVDNLLALADRSTPRTGRLQLRPPGDRLAALHHRAHLPSVVEHARVKTTPGKTRTDRAPSACAATCSRPDRHLAAFDLENTLIASNVVESYSWLATRRLDRRRAAALRRCGPLTEAPSLLALDRKDRGDFLRFFYRRYEDAPVAQLDEDAAELLSQLILTKSFPAAIRRVRQHRLSGTGPADHRRARLRGRAAAARCSTRSSPPR